MSSDCDNNNTVERTFEQRYHTLLAVFNSIDPALIPDRAGIILEANQAFATLFGKQLRECININIDELLTPKQSELWKIKADEALRTGSTVLFEEDLDGRSVRFSLSPVTDSNGTITQLSMIGQDITALQIAEKRSQKLQTFISALVESIPGAFYMLDAGGRFVEWNAYERDVIIGKPDGEMTDSYAIKGVHPEDRGQVTTMMMNILKEGGESSLEMKVLLHGGPEFAWHHLSAKRVIINDKPFFIGIATDITEHKISEDATLKNSEDRFRKLFEFHSAVKLLIDPETGHIIDANHAAAKFYGWSIAELRQMSMQEINTLSIEQVLNELEHNRLSGKQHLSFKHRTADGSVHDVEVFSTKINVGGKELFYAIVHDVTERKLAENQLKQMSVAVQQSPAVVIITDPQGNIEYVNPMFTEHSGYSAEEARGKNPRILQSGMMPKAVYENLWETILSGGIWEGELHNKKKNGQLFWESAIISAIRDSDGVITDFVAVKEDITEKKQFLDALIAAKEKAEESDRLKSAFLANISHEIRTPMNGILGFSELLKDPQLTGEEQVEYIDLIHQSGKRMLNLINDLIDISRIEAGETNMQIAETSVNQIIHNLCVFFKHDAEKKELRLHCTTPLPDTESLIVTDQSMLLQILTNLVQNALKFTKKGGIDIGYTRNNGTIEFYCHDTGIGIPADMKEKIFDRFHQVDNSLTRAHEGAGLGLSISKAYVEMLGGTIQVESVEGRGSRFFFTLPCNNPLNSTQTDKLSPDVVQETVASLPCGVVLIVEDDEISSYLLQRSLKSKNLTQLYAKNGHQAVELVKSHPEINLVLMDMKMPLMNGYEATRQIKQFRPDLPVIAQTAFTTKEENEKAKAAGCDHVITKPIKRKELLELTNKLLKR